MHRGSIIILHIPSCTLALLPLKIPEDLVSLLLTVHGTSWAAKHETQSSDEVRKVYLFLIHSSFYSSSKATVWYLVCTATDQLLIFSLPSDLHTGTALLFTWVTSQVPKTASRELRFVKPISQGKVTQKHTQHCRQYEEEDLCVLVLPPTHLVNTYSRVLQV